jgi:hypothetical protein
MLGHEPFLFRLIEPLAQRRATHAPDEAFGSLGLQQIIIFRGIQIHSRHRVDPAKMVVNLGDTGNILRGGDGSPPGLLVGDHAAEMNDTVDQNDAEPRIRTTPCVSDFAHSKSVIDESVSLLRSMTDDITNPDARAAATNATRWNLSTSVLFTYHHRAVLSFYR